MYQLAHHKLQRSYFLRNALDVCARQAFTSIVLILIQVIRGDFALHKLGKAERQKRENAQASLNEDTKGAISTTIQTLLRAE